MEMLALVTFQHHGQSFNSSPPLLSLSLFSPSLPGSSNRSFSSEDALWQVTWPGVGPHMGGHGQITSDTSGKGVCVSLLCLKVFSVIRVTFCCLQPAPLAWIYTRQLNDNRDCVGFIATCTLMPCWFVPMLQSQYNYSVVKCTGSSSLYQPHFEISPVIIYIKSSL